MPAPRGSYCPRSNLRVAFRGKRPWEKSYKGRFEDDLREGEERFRNNSTGGESPGVRGLGPVTSHLRWAPGSSSARDNDEAREGSIWCVTPQPVAAAAPGEAWAPQQTGGHRGGKPQTDRRPPALKRSGQPSLPTLRPQESLFLSISILEMLCLGLRRLSAHSMPPRPGDAQTGRVRGRKDSRVFWLLVSGGATWAMPPVQCRLILRKHMRLCDTSIKVAAVCLQSRRPIWDHHIHQNPHLLGSSVPPNRTETVWTG